MPGKATWITEFGYSNTPGDFSYGVDSATQAKNTLNGLLDAFAAGVKQTFLYELVDENSNIPSNASFAALGLFNVDGSAKPVAVALHNLSTILQDVSVGNSKFQPGNVSFSTSGLPGTASQILLEKGNGTYDLVTWNEPTDWNSATQSEVAVSPTTITVTVPQRVLGAKVYDPLQGSSAIANLGDVSSAQLTLTDHPIVFEFSMPTATPTGGGAVTPPAPGFSSVVGIPYTGVRLSGVSTAGTTLIVTDTVAGVTRTLGSTTASSNGTWSFIASSGIGHIDLSAVHEYSASAYLTPGTAAKSAGDLFLTDIHDDTLNARQGCSDVFSDPEWTWLRHHQWIEVFFR